RVRSRAAPGAARVDAGAAQRAVQRRRAADPRAAAGGVDAAARTCTGEPGGLSRGDTLSARVAAHLGPARPGAAEPPDRGRAAAARRGRTDCARRAAAHL